MLFRSSNTLIGESTGTSGELHGFLQGDMVDYVTVRDNLFVHSYARNPAVKGGSKTIIANNVVYNSYTESGWGMTYMSNDFDSGPTLADWFDNLYIMGPNNPTGTAGIDIGASVDPGSRIYFSGNSLISRGGGTPGVISANYAGAGVIATSPVLPLTELTIETNKTTLEANVKAKAGAFPGLRDYNTGNSTGDPVDERLINDVTGGTGDLLALNTWPAFPSWAATSRSWTPGEEIAGTGVIAPSNPDALQPSGYTALEEALHALAAAVE